jgi:hypothetical protein
VSGNERVRVYVREQDVKRAHSKGRGCRENMCKGVSFQRSV